MPEKKARNCLVFNSLQEFKSLFSKDDFWCPTTIGYVYCVEIGDEIKIGFTSNLWKRFSELESYARLYMRKPFKRLAFTEELETFKTLERHIHQTFWNKRLPGEMFNITFENAVNALEQVQAEPYPIENEEYHPVRKAKTNKNPRGHAIRLRNTINELYKGNNNA